MNSAFLIYSSQQYHGHRHLQLTDAAPATQGGELAHLSSNPRMSSSQVCFLCMGIISYNYIFTYYSCNRIFFHYTTQPPESFPFYLLISLGNFLPTPRAPSSSPHNFMPGSLPPLPCPYDLSVPNLDVLYVSVVLLPQEPF